MRVEIPMMVTSLDRMRPFAEKCVALVVSPHGCGFRSSRPLPVGTPVLLGQLSGGSSVTARVANCLPLGSGGQHFLIGASLYTHGNVWKIATPPADWDETTEGTQEPPRGAWPYKPAAAAREAQPGRK